MVPLKIIFTKGLKIILKAHQIFKSEPKKFLFDEKVKKEKTSPNM